MKSTPFILVCFAVTGMLLLAQCRDQDGTDDDVPKNSWQYDDSTHNINGDVNDDGMIIHDRTAGDTAER
jgi:hypothetical protein